MFTADDELPPENFGRSKYDFSGLKHNHSTLCKGSQDEALKKVTNIRTALGKYNKRAGTAWGTVTKQKDNGIKIWVIDRKLGSTADTQSTQTAK